MKELLKAKAEFRKRGVVLQADKTKSGGGGTWKFAGEDNVIKTIQAPLLECGLEIIATMESDCVSVILFHVGSGENIKSSIKLTPVIPRKDKNGNDMYLDAEIERGKQFGYWSRILTIRILGLSDIDPEDMQNRPEDMTDNTINLRKDLNELIEKSTDKVKTKNWILDTYKVTSIESLSTESLNHVINMLNKKLEK